MVGYRFPLMKEGMWDVHRRLENKPRPHNKNTTQKLKFALLRNKNYVKPHLEFLKRSREGTAQKLTWHEASNANTKARKRANELFGRGRITPERAATLLTIAEMRAARTIAKALGSSPVLKRVQNRRKARNFVREELSLYRRPNSNTIRPSSVKARRVNLN